MLNVPRLRILLELQRHGTLAAVAEVLAYSPSAVSQQLSALSAEVRVPLVEHVGRRLVLTAAGELLAGHAAALLERMETAEAELAESVQGLRGTVRVAAFQTAYLTLVPALASGLAEHPDVDLRVVHVQPDRGFDALVSHECDLLVAEEYPQLPLPRPAQIESRELVRDPLRLVTPAGAPLPSLAGGTNELRWVMEPEGNAARRWAEGFCRERGFEPRVRFETPDLLVQVRLVETGQVVAVLPDLVWAATRGADVDIHPLPGDPSRRILTATRRGASAAPLVRLVRRTLENVCGPMVGSANVVSAADVDRGPAGVG